MIGVLECTGIGEPIDQCDPKPNEGVSAMCEESNRILLEQIKEQKSKELNIIRASIKQKAKEHPNTRPSKAICPEAAKFETIDNDDVKNLRQVYNYHRSITRPKLPKSRAETLKRENERKS